MPVITPAKRRLEFGIACFTDGNPNEALYNFRRVAKNCPACTVGSAQRLCTCKDLLAACRGQTLEAELRKPCTCPQRSTQRCASDVHIAALTYMAAALMKLASHKEALVVTQNLVSMAPRNPKGYLRLGQILRIQQKQGDALAVYEEGIALVSNGKHADPVELQMLYTQRDLLRKVTAQLDPMKVFPSEIVLKIFRQLGTREHSTCLRVSKAWASFLGSKVAKPLWSSKQHYDFPLRYGHSTLGWIPTTIVYRNLSTFSGGRLKSLQIDDCKTFGLHQNRLGQVLGMCPALEHLKLRGSVFTFGNFPPMAGMPRLKTLYLGPEIKVPSFILAQFITAAAGTLEDLTVLEFPDLRVGYPTMQPVNWPIVPNLHSITLACASDSTRIDMETIMNQTPNVRVMRVDNMTFSNSYPSQVPNVPAWPKLQSVFIGNKVLLHMSVMRFPWLPESVTELVVGNSNIVEMCAQPWELPTETAVDMFSSPLPIGVPNVQRVIPYLPNLQKLEVRGRFALSPEAFKALLEPSITNNTLQHLELYPFPWAAAKTQGGLAWMGSKSLTYLGISFLIGEVGRHVDDADQSLLDLVGLFPNLRGLNIGQETVAAVTVGKIIESGITHLYHQQGPRMCDLTDWARTVGARVIHGYNPDSPTRFQDWRSVLTQRSSTTFL
ncbi:hypothetical protein BJ170DRAFT_679346 [Xylariales sp. AK1849]|nr:hypothetical protein BJ170DRAFT_679346 [Xylariales sp. AK1849]